MLNNLVRSLTTITRLSRHFWMLFLAHFTVNMSITLFFLLPLRIEDIGGTRAQIGLVMGIALGAGVIIRLFIGTLLDRYGRKIWLIISGLLVAIASFLYLFVNDIGVFLYMIRILHGFGSGMLFATFFTAAADIAPPGKQVEIIGLFGISGLLPMALGPILGEFLLRTGPFSLLFGVAAALSTLAFVMTFFLPETQPDRASVYSFRLSMLYRNGLVRIWVASFLFGAAVNACFNFLAPYTRTHGLPGISTFFGFYVLTSITIRLFLGNLPEKLGVFRLYKPAAIVLAIGLSLIGFAETQHHLILAACLIGFGHAYIFPILIALATQSSPLQNRGVVITLATAMIDLGGMCCSPLLGLVGDLFGYFFLFLLAGTFSLTAAFIFVRKSKSE